MRHASFMTGNHRSQMPERRIDRCMIRKELGKIRIDDNQIAPLSEALYIFPPDTVREIIFFEHIVIFLNGRHTSAPPWYSPYGLRALMILILSPRSVWTITRRVISVVHKPMVFNKKSYHSWLVEREVQLEMQIVAYAGLAKQMLHN